MACHGKDRSVRGTPTRANLNGTYDEGPNAPIHEVMAHLGEREPAGVARRGRHQPGPGIIDNDEDLGRRRVRERVN